MTRTAKLRNAHRSNSVPQRSHDFGSSVLQCHFDPTQLGCCTHTHRPECSASRTHSREQAPLCFQIASSPHMMVGILFFILNPCASKIRRLRPKRFYAPVPQYLCAPTLLGSDDLMHPTPTFASLAFYADPTHRQFDREILCESEMLYFNSPKPVRSSLSELQRFIFLMIFLAMIHAFSRISALPRCHYFASHALAYPALLHIRTARLSENHATPVPEHRALALPL